LNTRNLIILIIIAFVVLCILFGIIYRNQLLNSNKNNENSNIVDVNIYNETSDSIKNEEIDNSEKVAKLYNLPDNKIDNMQFSKDITQNTIDKIESMLKSNEQLLGMFSYTNAPDYMIEFNNSNLERSFGFRIFNDSIAAIVNLSTTYLIYREDDVKQLLELLDEGMRYNLNYTEIDINKTYIPPIIYINDEYEAVLGSYTWKDEQGNVTTGDLKQDPKTLLKDKEAVNGFGVPIISINANNTEYNLITLPNSTKISYSIYADNIDYNISKKDAERMINGSYHTYQPNILSEYIYEITITFTDSPGLSATYYFKYKV